MRVSRYRGAPFPPEGARHVTPTVTRWGGLPRAFATRKSATLAPDHQIPRVVVPLPDDFTPAPTATAPAGQLTETCFCALDGSKTERTTLRA